MEQENIDISADTDRDPLFPGTSKLPGGDDRLDHSNIDGERQSVAADERESADEEIGEALTDEQPLSLLTASGGADLWLYNTHLPGFFGFDGCQTPGERFAYIFCKSKLRLGMLLEYCLSFPLMLYLVLQFVSQIIPAYDGPRNAYRQLGTFAQTSPVLVSYF